MKRACTAGFVLAPGAALAHASERAVLMTLPTQGFIWGAGGAVALTAALATLGARLPAFRQRLLLDRPAVLPDGVVSWASALLFAGLVLLGLVGPRDPAANLLPLTIWTVLWVGLTLVQALFGKTFFIDKPTTKRVAAWRAKAHDRATADAGYAYAGYAHLKLAGIVEGLADLAARIAATRNEALPEDFRHRLWAEIRARGIDDIRLPGEGRNRFSYFTPALQEAARTRARLAADLRLALPQGQFSMVYQPIVELDTGAVTGVEALLRWQHPRRGLVRPDEFIPLAEESGLIVPIGAWVLERACTDAQRWRELMGQADFYVSVNVSARQLERPDLAQVFDRILRRTRMPARGVVLEVTESVVMSDPARTAATLESLRALGTRIAIDDFGTGYSSLAYLGRLPIDLVKIDRSFVSGVSSEDRNKDLAAMVVQLVGVLNLTAVAEGIQAVEQVQDLQRLGCGLGQGFYFSRPVSAQKIDALLAAEARERGSARPGSQFV